MFCHKQGEVRVLRLLLRIFVAVTVDRHDPVCIFIYNDSVRVHTERTHIILKFLCPVNDLALIKFIGQMGEDLRRDLHTHAQIDTVRQSRDLKLFTDFLHPLASASSDRDHAALALIRSAFVVYAVSVLKHFDAVYITVEKERYFLFQFFIYIFQHHIIDVRSEMPHRSIQKIQLILHT